MEMRIFAVFATLVVFFYFSFVVVEVSATVQTQPRHASQAKVLRSRQIGTQGQIISRLFTSEYDPNIRPPVRDSSEQTAIVVVISIYLNRIVWHKHSAEVDLYLRQQWEDARLSYDVDPREKIQEVMIPKSKKIWRPDTIFGGKEQQSGSSSASNERSRTIIEPSGYVSVREQRNVHVATEINSAFPVTKSRSFRLTIFSNSYSIDDVVYLWANSPPAVFPIEVSDVFENESEYFFTNAKADHCMGNDTNGVFGCIQIVVQFNGRNSDGWIKIILPCAILVISSWLHFFVSAAWSVPRSISAAFPFFIFVCLILFFRIDSCALLVWLIVCTLFTFASLIEFFVVIVFGTTIRRARHTNTVLQTSPKMAVNPSEQSYGQPQKQTLVIDNEEIQRPAERKPKCSEISWIDLVSMICFPVGFVIFFVVYLLIYW